MLERPRAVLPLALVVLVSFGVAFGIACGPERPTAPVVAPTSAYPGEEPQGVPDAPPPEPPEPALLSSSDAGQRETQTLFVREVRADCEGEGPRKCLQVRASETDDWTLFYSSIEGFTYEEGTKYELRVAVEPLPNAPADSSSRRYVLVEIVSQEKVPSPK